MQLFPTDPEWVELFAAERRRILDALGALTDGGAAQAIEHVGATSVPGVSAAPCVDIHLAVWPHPLPPAQQQRLEALGYALLPRDAAASEQRLRHASGRLQLLVVEAVDDPLHACLLRDYLRADDAARAAYIQRKQQLAASADDYPAALRALWATTLPAAAQWSVALNGLEPVRAVARELQAFPHPWYISSGWAIELFLGRASRVHHDVDVVVARADQLSLQTYMTERGWAFRTPYAGALEPWPPHMRLELPRHQALAFRDGAFVDFLLSEIDHGVWRYRRDPSIVVHADQIGLRTADGIPFLAPELVLLFKSKNTSNRERSDDARDYEHVRGALEPERSAWLRWALLRSDPDHPWISELA